MGEFQPRAVHVNVGRGSIWRVDVGGVRTLCAGYRRCLSIVVAGGSFSRAWRSVNCPDCIRLYGEKIEQKRQEARRLQFALATERGDLVQAGQIKKAIDKAEKAKEQHGHQDWRDHQDRGHDGGTEGPLGSDPGRAVAAGAEDVEG